MFYDDEYDEDNYDEDNYDEDNYDEDYGDEKEFPEDYQFYEQENIVDFAFKDIGAEGRVGGIIDEDMDINIGSTQMSGQIGKIGEKYNILFMDSDTKFAIDLKMQLIKVKELGLSEDDVSIIKRNLTRIPLIKYKNPLLYILGYYLHKDLGKREEFVKKLKNLTGYIKDNKNISDYELVKYARFWKLILGY